MARKNPITLRQYLQSVGVVRVTLYIPAPMLPWIKWQACKDGMSMTAFIEYILRQHHARCKKLDPRTPDIIVYEDPRVPKEEAAPVAECIPGEQESGQGTPTVEATS